MRPHPPIRAVSLDFGNTLYPFRSTETEASIRCLHDFLQGRLDRPLDYAPFAALYREIRTRQFTENRPSLRENDFTARIRAVIEACQDGRPAGPALVQTAEDAYADGFVEIAQLPEGGLETVARLAERYRVGVLSNFVRADCILRPLHRDGLLPHLKTVVVSSDIGFIKPHPAVFAALTEGLDVSPDQIVHVGDDWDADILGATRFGMRAAYTTEWRDEPDPWYGQGGVLPWMTIERLADLPGRLESEENPR